jgi:hypothetical protein
LAGRAICQFRVPICPRAGLPGRLLGALGASVIQAQVVFILCDVTVEAGTGTGSKTEVSKYQVSGPVLHERTITKVSPATAI